MATWTEKKANVIRRRARTVTEAHEVGAEVAETLKDVPAGLPDSERAFLSRIRAQAEAYAEMDAEAIVTALNAQADAIAAL